MRGLGVLCAAAVAAVPLLPATAVAQEAPRPAPVMVSLDASGSMTEQLPTGGTRMDAAKHALNSLVDGLPADTQLGLQVYGTQTGSSDAEKARGCQDIVTAQPVGPLNAAELKRKVDGIRPSGYTPIGQALRAAAEALPKEGPRAIVLISDGLDTCAPPDPCEVAKELDAAGVDLSVHTVGYQVDDQARQQLSCIAEATGGTYTDTDAGTLEQKLPTVVESARRSYEVRGTPVTGTPSPGNAPEVRAGQYVDTIAPAEIKHYRVKVPQGFTVHFAGSAIVPNDETSGAPDITAKIMDWNGETCARGWEGVALWRAHLTAAAEWTQGQGKDCKGAEEVVLSLERSNDAGRTTGKPWKTELLIVLEPPVTGNAGPLGDPTAVPFAAPGGAEQPVTGGGSFNDALELPGSGVYLDTLHTGEMATYKVRLNWGESLAVMTTADSNAVDGAAELTTSVFDSTRTRDDSWEKTIFLAHETETSEAITTPRVLYNNRTTKTKADHLPSVAGWYYITLEGSSSREQGDMPIRLAVSKVGQPAAGPQYAQVGNLPAAPIADAGEPVGGSGLASLEEQDSSGVPVWAWAAIAAVVVLGGGGAATLILLRRKQSTTPQQ
ncbi:VWA domain-containing protein [Saccharopolyspora sp. NPDC050642]|uniref:vWA domain-containing protein n=1 Tax=Saccharopolyspora sp. NPDC050642 TaxID=3157099 RepID=UPI0033EE2BEB